MNTRDKLSGYGGDCDLGSVKILLGAMRRESGGRV